MSGLIAVFLVFLLIYPKDDPFFWEVITKIIAAILTIIIMAAPILLIGWIFGL